MRSKNDPATLKEVEALEERVARLERDFASRATAVAPDVVIKLPNPPTGDPLLKPMAELEGQSGQLLPKPVDPGTAGSPLPMPTTVS